MQFLGHYRYSEKNRNRLGAEPLFQYEMIAADGVINGGDALFPRFREQCCTICEAIILFSLQSLLMENAIQYCSGTKQRNANSPSYNWCGALHHLHRCRALSIACTDGGALFTI